MSTGDKTLSFLYPANLSKEIKEEGYIRNKTDEFVIKSISTQGCWKTITAKLNVEDLEGKVFELFDTTNETITNCINLALAGTGWIVGTCNVTKRRTVRKTNSSSWDIIQEAKKVYRCELEFDTLNKKVNIYEKRGNDKGVYFLDSLNLKDLSIQGDSYDFYTRIIAKGKDDLKVVLENFQYSNKVKTYIWKDERYTDIDSLTEDAETKLDELSKPYRAYSATVIDLANISKAEYKDILSYGLGDVITLVSKENGIKEKQRIVKIVEYPDEPTRNTCEIANTTLSFEDIQKEFQDTTDTVNNITTDNGTVDGSTIDGISTEQIYDFEASVAKITDLTVVNARIDDLYANKANISELNTVIANVAELNATKANITDLNVINANIEKLIATDATINNALIGKADITELNAVKGTINVLESDTANIKNLLAGNISGESGQLIHLTASNVVIADAVIKDLIAANISVENLKTSDISTTKFRIVSDSGNMLISDNTIQISDKNRVRVQIGKDASNDYNMYVWDSTGKLMFDATGLKADGIKNKIIRDDMISDNANIDGAKLNISSLITEINKDTNTSVIKSTKVQIDSLNQTLDIAFTSLKSNVDNTEIVGRNLLKNSNPKDNTYWREASGGTGTRSIINISDSPLSGITKGFQFVKDSGFNNIDYSQDNVRVVKGRTYTMSCYARCISGSTKLRLQYGKNPYPSKEIIINSTDNSEWEKYTFTFKFNEDTNNLTNIYFGAGSTQGTIQVCGMLLQEGAKSGTWVSAPEDIDSSIEDVKQITESNSTTINVMQGQIATAINNTQIVKDGQTILLKDDYNRTVSLVNSINSTIGTHTTKIDELSGNITSVDTKVNSVQRDLEGTKSTVSSHTSQINGLNSTVSTQGASISQLQNQIALKVEQTDITTAINKMNIGVRNLAQKTSKEYTTPFSSFNGGTNKTAYVANVLTDGLKVGDTVTVRLLYKYTDIVAASGETAQCWLQGSGNVTEWSSGGFNSSSKLTLSGNGEYEFLYSFTINTNHLKNSYWSVSIRHDYVQSGSVQWKMFKVEKGTKATDWTPALEDVDSSIANVQTQVTTTSNKVASIETNLSSITSRVSSVESTTTTINGNVTSLQSRMNTAEQKITSTAILNAVNEQINNGGSITTTSTKLEKNKFTIYNGALIVQNNKAHDVMWCNTEGWLTAANLYIYGDESPSNLEIGGVAGNKGIGIRTPDGNNTVYLDFAGLNKDATYAQQQASGRFHRIASYAGSRDTLNIEVAKKLNIKTSSTSGAIEMAVQGSLATSGNISTTQNVTATGSITAGGFKRSGTGYTLIATDTIDTIKYANNGGKSYIEIRTPSFGTWGADLWASDENLKENVEESTVNALDEVLKLKHKSFDYIDGINVENGFIAQELAEISEDLVLRIKQEDGSEIVQPRASGIIPWITKAIQEQNVYVRQLEEENQKLKEESISQSEMILDTDYRLTCMELGL